MLNSNLGDWTYYLSCWLQFHSTCKIHSNTKLIESLIHVLEIGLELGKYSKRKNKSVTFVGEEKLSNPKIIG